MAPHSTIIISKIASDFSQQGDQLFKLLKNASYTDQDGYGFIGITYEEGQIDGRLINRTSTYVSEYDYSKSEFIQRPIFIFSEISFSINTGEQLLIIYGTSSQLKQFRSIFNKIWTPTINITPIELSPFLFYKAAKIKNILLEVVEVSVNKFIYNDSFSGRFTSKVLKQKAIPDLFNRYETDIIKILTRVFVTDKEEFLLQVNSNGSLKLVCEEADFKYYFDFIKDLIVNTHA